MIISVLYSLFGPSNVLVLIDRIVLISLLTMPRLHIFFFFILKGIWYLSKVASLCKQPSPVSTCLRPKCIKLCFQNLGNGRKDKDENNFLINLAKIELFLIFQTNSCLSTSVYIFFTIFQILETKFYVFWTRTCRNLKLIQFSNFLSITYP